MNVKSFLVDRIVYIAAYAFNVALVLIVVQLGLFENDAPLSWENVLYAVVLSAVVFILFFFLDYVRQRPFYKRLNLLRQRGIDPANAPLLQRPVTREQNVFREVLEQQHRDNASRLAQLRQHRKQHLHFVNQWVHQMKTPVSVIQLLLQKLAETRGYAEQRTIRDSMWEETEKLVHGLETMLYTARLDDFSLDVKGDRVDVVHLLREVVHQHKKACIRYAVFPKMETEQEEVVVQTDAKWMRFVLNQLMTNGIKYSRNQPGSQTLQIRVFEDEVGWHVSIRDEGIGIPKQDLPRVFDAFFTGANGREFPESTGMGLYLAKQVCDRLGHRLRLQSEVGEGTTATVTFLKNRHVHER